MFPAVKDYPPGTELIYRDARNRQSHCVVMRYTDPDTAIDSQTGDPVPPETVPSFVVVGSEWRTSSQEELKDARQRFAAKLTARGAQGDA